MAEKENWGSRVGLVLAMAGNAVGLGNFLRFPAQAIQNGGGAFIIPYLTCFVLMGLPLLLVEWSMGRYGGKFGQHTTPYIFSNMGKKDFWKYVGVLGIFINVGIASYYCYIESWTLSWMFHGIIGTFSGKTQTEVSSFFSSYVALENIQPIIFWLICLFLNTWILSKGLKDGVEKTAKIMMPLLLIFGAILAFKGVTLKAGVHEASFDGVLGLNFLWEPKFESIMDPVVWRNAAGQIFFTLSLGMGSIHCYASYLKSRDDIALNAMSAGWMNEFVEVVLGSALIVPIAVGYLGIDKVVELTKGGSGFGIGFMTLPYLFSKWGAFLSVAANTMWFALLFFAGITSSLAMGTPCMSFMEDKYGISRKKAAVLFGLAVLILGIPSVISQDAFNEFDYWVGTVALVVFALFEIVLFAWIFGMEKGWQEINAGADIKVPMFLKFTIKYVTPIFLMVVFLGSLPEIWSSLKTCKSMAVMMSRILMVSVFIAISLLVYYADKKKGEI